jgi:succinate dehydrogenase / fumarate reductase cytochrome b subunit
MYLLVSTVFHDEWWYSILYILAMILLSFHLQHGFSSAFQTLGLEHKKYTPVIKGLGALISILIPLGFASMPIYFMILG